MQQIGVLTLHSGLNFGAFLQTLCLTQVLSESRDVSVQVINYRNQRQLLLELFFGLKPYNPRTFFSNMEKWSKFRNAMAHLPLTRPMRHYDEIAAAGFDLIVVGSDEVWNVGSPITGFDPTYYNASLAPRVVAYAASCGPFNVERLTIEKQKRIGRELMHFDAISVRDPNTALFIEKLGHRLPPITLDPCFLASPAPASLSLPSDYAVLYACNLPQARVNEVVSIAHRRGLELVSIGYAYQAADMNLIGIGPLEWLALMQNASIVFTSMFHGLVYSLKYKREFVFISTPYRQYKIAHLVAEAGCSSRIVAQDDCVIAALEKPWDAEHALQNLTPGIELSLAFIRDALKRSK